MIIGGFRYRTMYWKTKDSPTHEMHEHDENHNTIVFTGGVHVECDDPEVCGDYYAPQIRGPKDRPCIVFIRAGMKHRLNPLMDNTFCYCAFDASKSDH